MRAQAPRKRGRPRALSALGPSRRLQPPSQGSTAVGRKRRRPAPVRGITAESRAPADCAWWRAPERGVLGRVCLPGCQPPTQYSTRLPSASAHRRLFRFPSRHRPMQRMGGRLVGGCGALPCAGPTPREGPGGHRRFDCTRGTTVGSTNDGSPAAPPCGAARGRRGSRAARRPLWAGNRASDRGVPGSLASRVYSSPDSLTPFGSKKCEPGCPPDRRRLRSRADPPQGLGPRLPVRRGPLLLGPAQTTAGPPLRSGTTGRCVCGYRTAQAVARSSPRSSSAAKVATTFGSSASQIPTGSPGRPPITSMR